MSNLFLQELSITHFRNYEKETVSFSTGLNCLTGRNGMGKTNLLDAIYYLCMTKSRVNSLDKYVIQHGSEFIRLEADFRRNDKAEKIVAKVIPSKSKVIERNKRPYSKLAEHIGFLPVVIIMPDDTTMVLEGSEERRRFIDNTLCQLDADYLAQLMKYNQLLKQRNALLKQSEGRVDTTLLSIYDQQMATPAQIIYAKRQAFIERFIPIFQERYTAITQGAESVSIRYQSQLSKGDYTTLTKESFQKDSILQRTTVGIHKDDLVFTMQDQRMKRYASQGQLKSYVLSLGLARYEILKQHQNIQPILLLDDIFDKLDEDRVGQLLALLSKEEFGQIFLTDTHEDRIRHVVENFTRAYSIYNIDKGQVRLVTHTELQNQ